MTRFLRRMLAAAVFSLLSGQVFGEETMSDKDPAVAAVLELNGGLNDAALSGDAAFLADHLAESFVVSDPSNAVRRRDDLVALFAKAEVSYLSYEATIDFAEQVASGLVVLMGTETGTLKAAPGAQGAVGRRMSRRFTNVFREEADGWKLLVKQSTIIEAE